jgi:uncharacterized protein (TIRG00374 family)
MRKIGVTVLKIGLTIVLMALILSKIGLGNLLERFSQVNLRYVAAAAAISILFSLLKSFKWYYLIKRVIGAGTYKDAVRTYLIGMGLAAVTPGRVGEFGRAYYLQTEDRAFSAGVVAVDRLLDLVVVFALACAGAFVIVGGGLGWTCVGAAAVTLVVLYWPERPVRLATVLLRKIPVARRLESLLQGFRAVTRATLTNTLLLTVLYYGLVVLEYYVLLSGFERVPFAPVLLVVPLVIVTNAFQITIGGLGVREGASVLLFSRFGISEEAAVNATFMISMFNILIPGLVGAVLSAHHPGPRRSNEKDSGSEVDS